MKRQVYISLLLLGLALLSSTRGANDGDGPLSTKPTSGSTATSPVPTPPGSAVNNNKNSSSTSSAPTPESSASNATSEANNTTPATTEPTTTTNVTAPTTGEGENTTAAGATPTTSGGANKTAETQPSASTEASHTTAPNNKSEVTSPPAPTTTPSVENSTAAQTSTPAPNSTASMPSENSTAAPTAAPVTTDVLISETNLLLATEKVFVELKGPKDESVLGLSLVVFNGTSAKQQLQVDFDNSSRVFSSSGIWREPIDTEQVQSLTSVVIALYQTKDYNSSLLDKGLVDFALFCTDLSATVASSIREIMLPGGEPLTYLKTGLSASQNLSLSRCGKDAKNASVFVPAAESDGRVNPCPLTPNSTVWTLQLNGTGKNCDPEGIDAQKQTVENKLVEELNKRCQCGLTTLLMHSNLTCAVDLYLEFTLKESYKGQVERVMSAFVSFANDNSSMMVGSQKYSVVNCTSMCRMHVPPHNPPSGNSKANTSVTVAVVLSCIAAFLIVLVSVILYMRGKRKGIIRQFRMTRLQEDDDMDDMDDFIGSGPSFSTHNSR